MKYLYLICAVSLMIFFNGCVVNSKSHILASKNQVKLRSFQTRDYESKSKEEISKAVIAVLQDLSFIVEMADFDLGTITATKFDGYYLKMTVTIRAKNKAQTMFMVRSNIQYQNKAIEEPKPYQDFFASLDKALFLKGIN